MNVGFQVFATKSDYNAAKSYQVTAGASANISAAQQSLVQNYNTSTTGFSFSAGYPIKRSFKRVGFTYSLNKTSITTFSQASANLFQTLAFRGGIAGPERA